MCVQAHGEDNPRRSAIENNLGRVLNRLGAHREAREHFEAAMSIDQAEQGRQQCQRYRNRREDYQLKRIKHQDKYKFGLEKLPGKLN